MQELAFWKAVVVDESSFLEAPDEVASAEALLDSLNVAGTDSKLRVQDPRCAAFVSVALTAPVQKIADPYSKPRDRFRIELVVLFKNRPPLV